MIADELKGSIFDLMETTWSTVLYMVIGIYCLFLFQPMVRVRESPTCAICEFVMKQLESMLEDQATEVCFRMTI